MMILMGKWSVVPLGVFIAASVYFGQKIEKIKKKNDIQTYREVVAFTEGVRLDEIQRQREIGKRPYQKILMAVAAAVVAATVSFVIAYAMLAIINS